MQSRAENVGAQTQSRNLRRGGDGGADVEKDARNHVYSASAAARTHVPDEARMQLHSASAAAVRERSCG